MTKNKDKAEKNKLTKQCVDLFKGRLTWECLDVSLKGDIHIETRQTITYSLLDELSKLFKTSSINISSETRNDGMCETCSFEYSVNILSISDAKFGN